MFGILSELSKFIFWPMFMQLIVVMLDDDEIVQAGIYFYVSFFIMYDGYATLLFIIHISIPEFLYYWNHDIIVKPFLHSLLLDS